MFTLRLHIADLNHIDNYFVTSFSPFYLNADTMNY